jgi:hypothetical protein
LVEHGIMQGRALRCNQVSGFRNDQQGYFIFLLGGSQTSRQLGIIHLKRRGGGVGPHRNNVAGTAPIGKV